MSEKNHMDDLMKSILESGQEEVPAHIWEGISSGLDKAAKRKAIVVWFRRAGAVAAAAVIAAGVFLNMNEEVSIVADSSDNKMIAVVEQEIPSQGTQHNEVLLADAGKTIIKPLPHNAVVAVKDTPELFDEDLTETETVETEEYPVEKISDETKDERNQKHSHQEEQVEWNEDDTELKERKIKTSIVLAGMAGTNTPQNKGGISPMRSPVMDRQYTKTTVEQTSTETLYGIPMSFGAGVRLHFNTKWSLGVGVNYTILTSRFNGKYIKVEDGTAQAPISANVRNLQHYVGIPVNAYYTIASQDFISFYAYAGGSVEKCVMNKFQVQSNPVIHHSETVNSVQLSATVGLGIEFMLGKHAGIYIDPSLRYYFKNRQPKSIRTAQPLMLGFEMGLRFNI